MIFRILQITTPSGEEIQSKADSLKAVLDQYVINLVTNPKETVTDLGQKALDFGMKVLMALLIYIIGIWLIRRIKKAQTRIFEKKHTDRTIASFVSSFTSVTLTVLLIVITIGTLGVNTSSIAALLAAGGMAIGLALSGTVQNFAGGLMILIFKPFKSGDIITAQEYTGTVKTISIVNTTITTSDNRAVIIPNGTLFSGTIDNYSGYKTRRVEWIIGLDYNTDADKCITLIKEMLSEDTRILNAADADAQDPFAELSSLSASSVDFTVRAWVKADDYWDVFYAVNKKLYTELPKHGFSFPYPQMDIHLFPNSADTSEIPDSKRDADDERKHVRSGL